MDRIPILGGAYQSRSIISGAQRCINLFPEKNDDEQAPVPVTHFPTPGLTLKGTPPVIGASRGLYRAPNGDLYQVVRNKVYYVSPNYVYTELGTLLANMTTRVGMSDNGIVLLIVDGTVNGYAVNLTTRAFARITDPNFLGATNVAFTDGFFVLNAPGTNSWYISLPYVTYANLTAGTISPGQTYAAFDPLDIASKAGASDNISNIVVMHRTVWLIGDGWSSEAWYNSGAADFPFAITPGVFFEHGTIAPQSVAWQDLSLFFLSVDRFGTSIIMRINADYSVNQLSSRGIEYIISQMTVISDAISGCYQQNGHAFYIITFPTSNRTFACELKTGQWHELAWTDTNGVLNRHRANTWAFAYGINLIGDWQNGKLYQLDINNFTDFDGPITRIRTIPHVIANGERLRADVIMADLQGGTLPSANDTDPPPKVFLRVSTDRGGSFGQPVEGDFGAAGDYGQFPIWRNMGYARDFVFELSWSASINTALNGLFVRGTKGVGDG